MSVFSAHLTLEEVQLGGVLLRALGRNYLDVFQRVCLSSRCARRAHGRLTGLLVEEAGGSERSDGLLQDPPLLNHSRRM